MTRGRRILASRYLRTLATIEHLDFMGNQSEVHRLLDGIDPAEARELADEFDAENLAPVIPIGNLAALDYFPESIKA